MNGAQETPAVTTTAFGAAVFAVNPSNGQVRVLRDVRPREPRGAPRPTGARGTPGGVLVPLEP
jgi:hypothetical protein